MVSGRDVDIYRNLANPEYFALSDLNLFKRRLMAKHSRTSNLEKGTLSYMAPDESILTIPYIVWQYLLAFLFRGLAFSPHKIFTTKNKIHAPKENQCTTLWHFNGFLPHEMIHLFFFLSSEKRFSGRDVELIFIAIYLAIFCPLILVGKVHILAKNSVPRVFHLRPRVFHQTPSFPHPGNPYSGPWIFHKLLPRPREIITS